jgi:hypothetical protein
MFFWGNISFPPPTGFFAATAVETTSANVPITENKFLLFISFLLDPGRLTYSYERSAAAGCARIRRILPRAMQSVQASALRFQLSGMLQYYSALPLNIASGVTTIQRTAGRPTETCIRRDPRMA